MPNWLSWPTGWADFLQVVGVPLALLALLFGWLQLRKAARTARVQVLLALDESLSDFEDIRQKVNRGELITKRADEIRLRRYIGAFERVGYALRVKEIKLKIVDQFYGSRFKYLIAYLFNSSYARSIVENQEGWKDFYYLWDRLLGYYSLWDKLLGRRKNCRELPPVDRIKELLDCDAKIANSEEGVALYRAVTLYRALAADNPGDQGNLAAALNDLSVWLDEVGRYQEALAASEEAVTLYRALAADNPSYQGNLAIALDNLGNRFDRAGSHEEALAARAGSVGIYRELASEDPGIYQERYRRALSAFQRGAG